MKKSKLLVVSLLSIAAISLSACNNANTPSSSSNSENGSTTSENSTNNSSSASTNSQNGNNSSSSQDSVEKNVIFIVESSHITITADKQLAAPGEVVKLTVKVDEGYLFDSILLNGVAISGYEFVMPNKSAKIEGKVTALSTEGMMLTGGISEKLVEDKDTHIWSAKNVKINTDTNVIYSINGKQLSLVTINNAKTFADIKLPSAGNQGGFIIAGGATYDFFYDPADRETPCYVQRVSVNELPNSPEALETMFGGSVKSETCVYPAGVTQVEYTSDERDDDYIWNLYSDNSSLATVKKNVKNGKEKGVVYKSIDNGVYTVVDSYIEKHNGYATTTKESDDSEKFAGRYDMVSAYTSGHRKYQKLTGEAIADANMYSHTMESIDFDIMYAYRTGFRNDIADDIYKSKIDVKSVANADGTFTTTVDSWVTVKKSGATSGIDASYHNEFDVEITFTKAGGLLELSYYERNYNEGQYDIDGEKFKPGKEDQPINEKNVTCKYTYGEKLEGKPEFDTTPYFVSSISNAKIVNSLGEEDTISRMDTVEVFEQASTYKANGKKYVSFDYEPKTALDVWQYGITSSSNKTVINNKNNDSIQYPFEWVGQGKGDTTLTIGNHTNTSGVKGSVDVTIPEQQGNVKSVWFYTVTPYNKDGWTANAGTIYAGATDKVKVTATLSNNSYDQNADLSFESSNPDLLKVEYNQEDGYLYLDATNAMSIETETQVKLTVNASYDESYTSSKSTMTIYIVPAQNKLDSVVGEWQFNDPDGIVAANGFTGSMTFTETTYDADPSKFLGTITCVDVNKDKGTTDTFVVEFAYSFDANTQEITAKVISTTKNGEKFGQATTLRFSVDISTGNIGVFCEISQGYGYDDEGNLSASVYELLGYDESDEGMEDLYYDDFVRKA